MSQARTRHHYVPKFYLRRFADQKGRLDAWRRTDGKRLVISVDNAAVEAGLYEAVDPEGNPTNAAEEVISEIESKVAPALPALVAGPWPPDLHVRGLISNLVALQITRTRESLHSLSAIADQAMKLGLSALDRDAMRNLYVESEGVEPTEAELDDLIDDIQDSESYRVDPHPNELVEAIFLGAADLVQSIASRNWFLQVSKKPLLATSDVPVHMWSAPDRARHGVGAFTADEIWFPLDSRHNLLMVHDSLGFEEQTVEIPSKMAKEISGRIADASYEWVFADPRYKVLDQLRLPHGARPVAYAGGEALWGPHHKPS